MNTPVRIAVQTAQGAAQGLLLDIANAPGAVVMVGGAVGGTLGPSGVYMDLGQRLADVELASLRLEYRNPNQLEPCVEDVLAAIGVLGARGISRLLLIGWSFGGAVVITAGATSSAVLGVATIASQTYGTDAVARLAPRSLLLLHGTADSVLSASGSKHLYARAGEPKELVLFEGDGHGIERHRQQMLQTLYEWCVTLLIATLQPRAGSASAGGV